jgi:hypothetical protein
MERPTCPSISIMIHQTKKKGGERSSKNRASRENIVQKSSNHTAARDKKGKNGLIVFHHIQIIKTTMNGATLMKRGAAELHILLARCKDHPELADDEAAKAEVTADAPLLLSLLLLELVVVPVGGGAVVLSPLTEVPPIKAGVVRDPATERDVGGTVGGTVGESAEEPEDKDDEEVSETGEEIRVMAKAGLVSPESPNKTMM